ncbi:hypothetical protein [Lichenibacterium dinghuense]|uniref:hypothetical protein n=1 Tax=Lichenibacterium dinghuense TaxID=2895977 RepID=UPI001F33607B|nr:hypothetical protein [Lichenibacterium sp. 6Y81]
MSAPVTRRRALVASAAAALGIGAGVAPALAAPAAVPAVSPETKALQAELARLSREYRVACREADEVSERVEYPDPPEALYVRPGDRSLFMRQPEPSWSDKANGRDWWADPRTVEHLRNDAFRRLDGLGCPAACARRDEILAAIERWEAEDTAAEDAVGYTAAQDRFDAASAAYRAFRIRLVEMRTDDPDALTVKALAIVDLCDRSEARLDSLIARAMERDSGAHETALALSMARDFIALFGTSAWVSA